MSPTDPSNAPGLEGDEDFSPETLRSRVSAWLDSGKSGDGLGIKRGSVVGDSGVDGHDLGENGQDPGHHGGDRTAELRTLAVGTIEPNPFQPRRVFDDDALQELTDSVRTLGVLQPILVRPNPAGGFTLIAGERRWRAARRAGLRNVPALVRHTDDQRALEEAIVENLHRADLNAIEEAAALHQLMHEFGLTQDEAARRVGKSRSAVANTLRLLALRPAVQALVAEGSLTAGHARALLSLEDPRAQERLARRILDEELSVRAAEKLAKTEAGPRPGAQNGSEGPAAATGGRSPEDKPAWALEIQERLSERLDTRVEVQERAGTGRLMIQFADEEDLDRIYRLLR